MKLNKIDEVWNSANLLFSDVFGLLSSRNLATIATWRNDFSSLLHTSKRGLSRSILHLAKRSKKITASCQTREKANRCQPREIDSGCQALRRKKVTGAKRGNWSLRVQITGNRNRMPSAVDRLWVNNGYQAREKDDGFTRREKDKGYQAREIHKSAKKKKPLSCGTYLWKISQHPL